MFFKKYQSTKSTKYFEFVLNIRKIITHNAVYALRYNFGHFFSDTEKQDIFGTLVLFNFPENLIFCNILMDKMSIRILQYFKYKYINEDLKHSKSIN